MKALITLLLAGCFLQIPAQNEFQKHFKMSQFSALTSYNLPGGILFRGLDSNGLDEGFCMVDAGGRITWHQFFLAGSMIANSIMTPLSETEYCHINPLFHEVSIYKTLDNALAWEKKYPEHPEVILQDFPFGVMQFKSLANGQLFVAAKSITVVNLPNGPIGVESPVFFLFDANGNLLWSKMHKIGNDNFAPVDFIENASGDLLVTGTFWEGVEGNTVPRGIGTIVVDRNNGNIAGAGTAYTYADPDADFSVGMIDDVSNAFVVTGFNLNGSSPDYSFAYIIKLNDDGTFGQAARFDATDPDCSVNLRLVGTSGNMTYLAGNYLTDFPATGHSFVNTFSLKTDTSASEVLWAKRYGPEPVDVGGQVLTTFYNFIINEADNTLLFSGSNELSSGYLWKANQSTGNAGCESVDVGIILSAYSFNGTFISTSVVFGEYLVEGSTPVSVDDQLLTRPEPDLSDYCLVSGTDKTEVPDNALSLYPNPANNMVTVSCPECPACHIALYDVCGKMIADYFFENQNTMDINVSQLKSGVYFVKVSEKNGKSFGNKKLILQ